MISSLEAAMLQLPESFVRANVARVMTLTTAMMQATLILLRAMFLGNVWKRVFGIYPLVIKHGNGKSPD